MRTSRIVISMVLVGVQASLWIAVPPGVMAAPTDPAVSVETRVQTGRTSRSGKPMVQWVTPRQTATAKQLIPNTLTLELDGIQYDDVTSIDYDPVALTFTVVSALGVLNCVSGGNSQNLPPIAHVANIDQDTVALATYGLGAGGEPLAAEFDPFDSNGSSVGPGPLFRLRSTHGDAECGPPDRVPPLFADGFE